MGENENYTPENLENAAGQHESTDKIAEQTRSQLGNLDNAVHSQARDTEPKSLGEHPSSILNKEPKKEDTSEKTEHLNQNDIYGNDFAKIEQNTLKALAVDQRVRRELLGSNKSLERAYIALMEEKTSSGNARFDSYKNVNERMLKTSNEAYQIVVALSAVEKEMGKEKFKNHIGSAKNWNGFESFFSSTFGSKEMKDQRTSTEGEVLAVNEHASTEIEALKELIKSDPSKALRELQHDIAILTADAEEAGKILMTDGEHIDENLKKEIKEILSKKAQEMQEKNITLERRTDIYVGPNLSYNEGKGVKLEIPLTQSINISDKNKVWNDALNELEKAPEGQDKETLDLIAELRKVSSDKVNIEMNTENNYLIMTLDNRGAEPEVTEYVATDFQPEKSIEAYTPVNPERVPSGLPQPLSNDFRNRTYSGHTPEEVNADPSILEEYEFIHKDQGRIDVTLNKGWLINKEGKIIGMYMDSDKKQIAWINTPPNSQKFLVDFPFTTMEDYKALPKEFSQEELAKLVMEDPKQTEKYQFYASYQRLPDASGENKAFRLEVKAYQKQEVAKTPEVVVPKKDETKKTSEKKLTAPINKAPSKKVTPKSTTPEKKPVINTPKTSAQKKPAETQNKVTEKKEVMATDLLAKNIYKNLDNWFDLKIQASGGSATYKDGILSATLDPADTTPDGIFEPEYAGAKNDLIAMIHAFKKKNPKNALLDFKKDDALHLEVRNHVLMIGSDRRFSEVNNAQVDKLFESIAVLNNVVLEEKYFPKNPGMKDIKLTKQPKELHIKLNNFSTNEKPYVALDVKKEFFKKLPKQYKDYLGLKDGVDVDIKFAKNTLIITKGTEKERTKKERISSALQFVENQFNDIAKIYGVITPDITSANLKQKAEIIFPRLQKIKEYIAGIRSLNGDDTVLTTYEEKLKEYATAIAPSMQDMYKTTKTVKDKVKYQVAYKDIYNHDIQFDIDKRDIQNSPATLR
ncbi:MAG: hypothetical protein ACK4NC_02305 [Candidatus Gracilibacteria bacterium]